MAKDPGREQSADDLKLDIARSRDQFVRDLRVFRREIDIPRRIRSSFQRQTAVWITAAVVLGAVLILLPARRKTVYVGPKVRARGKGKAKVLEAGFALGALKFAATMLKPVVVSFLTKKMHGYMGVPRDHAPKNRAMF